MKQTYKQTKKLSKRFFSCTCFQSDRITNIYYTQPTFLVISSLPSSLFLSSLLLLSSPIFFPFILFPIFLYSHSFRHSFTPLPFLLFLPSFLIFSHSPLPVFHQISFYSVILPLLFYPSLSSFLPPFLRQLSA